LLLDAIYRAESMWKKLGKVGLAVKAPWPVADEEDKLLTRQAKFLRDGLKRFRGQAGKAKKGWKGASIVVTESYPQWKLDTLMWMQEQYSDEAGFPATFMKDLKGWTGKNVSDKKMIKFTMQFASFMKNEVAEVGKVAMDTHLPFDQGANLEGSLRYFKAQLNIKEMDIIKLDTSAEGVVPERVAENVNPGKPFLWMR
jgi:leucyl-tRNA synthetase